MWLVRIGNYQMPDTPRYPIGRRAHGCAAAGIEDPERSKGLPAGSLFVFPLFVRFFGSALRPKPIEF